MEKKYPNLFTPIKIGNFVARNRIALAPTDMSSANADGSVNQRVITWHEQIAKGGTGLIIVGASTPDRTTGRPTVTCISVDEDPMIPGLANLAEAMHRHGAKCAVQIQHPGRQSAWPRKDMISASDMVVSIPGSAGHEVVYADSIVKGKSIRQMSVEEVYALIDNFAEGAWRVQQAGFDAVELHGAHGYMIAQFMSPYVNKRNDRFGGTFIDRMRFPLEIIDRIKRKCGRSFPVGIRYSAVEFMPGSRDLEESVKVAKLMEEAGVAWIDVSMGIFDVPGPTMDPMYYPQAWSTYAAEEIKKNVKIPVIATHTLRDPDVCDKIIEKGQADMVGLSRQLIADPYWANKAYEGKPEEIRKCVSCLVGCWQESLMIKREMRCAINPAVGDERFINFEKAKESYSVAIVGGGPAGMEAARIATLRGHKVTIFEKTGELGGAILLCCSTQGFSKMKWYSDWIRRQIAKLGVEVKLNTEPSIAELKEFDLVLYAGGAVVDRPNIPGINEKLVVTFEEVLRCTSKNCEYYPKDRPAPVEVGQKVVVWGDYFGAINSVERLAAKGKDIILVTPEKEFAQWYEPVHRDVLIKRFNGGNGEGLGKDRAFSGTIETITNATITEITAKGDVTIMDKDFQKKVIHADNVVLANAVIDDSYFNKLKDAGLLVQKIGDCNLVTNLRHAVTEGANTAFAIDIGMKENANHTIISVLPTEQR